PRYLVCMKQRMLLGVVVLMILLGVVGIGLSRYWPAKPAPVALPTVDNKLLAAVAPPAPAKTAPVAEPAAEPVYQTPQTYDGAGFAPSLADTALTGRLAADAEGNLMVTPEVRD